MNLAVYLPLVLPLLAAAAARPLAELLPPRAATWLLACGAVALAVASSAALGLLALSALIRIPLVDSLGEISLPVISRADPASLPVAAAGGALLTVTAIGAGLALWRRGAALIAAGREARSLPGTGQVVVVPDESADAYTLPGWPCRIVVTAGMMRALSQPEREVMLAHERAHATGFHYLFTTAACLAAAANPFLRPVATAVSYTAERWADEHAAAALGDRELVARAIARAALAAAAAPARRAGPVAALGMITRQVALRGAGPVPRRVAALLRPAPQRRTLLVAAGIALVAVAGISAMDAASQLHGMLEYASVPY